MITIGPNVLYYMVFASPMGPAHTLIGKEVSHYLSRGIKTVILALLASNLLCVACSKLVGVRWRVVQGPEGCAVVFLNKEIHVLSCCYID